MSSSIWPELRVGPKFDSKVCIGCAKEEICRAGIFMTKVKSSADDSRENLDHHREFFSNGYERFPETGGKSAVEYLIEELQKGQAKYDASVQAAEVLIREVILLTGPEGGRVITRDNIYQPALDKFKEAPATPGESYVGGDALEKIARSVLFYSEQGVCGAIEVEKLDP